MLKRFWGSIESFITNNLKLDDTLDFECQNIIFNTVHPNVAYLSNMIILLSKQFIYRCSSANKIPQANNVISEVYKIHSYELYYAKQNSKLSKHRMKLQVIFPDTYHFDTKEAITDNFISDYISTM